MRPLTALEALGRGLANTRGNLETVAVAAASSVGALLCVLLSVVPWIGSAAFAPWISAARQPLRPEEISAWVERLLAGPGALATLGLATAALLVGLTAASFLYCWSWGGVLAVLHAGDAQAPPGSGRAGPLFRTWSRRFFALEAARLTWKLLGFLSLFFALLCGVLLAVVLLVGAAVLLGSRSGAGAGFALGCGGALPLAFVYFAVSAAMWIGQVELVRPETGVGAAARAGFALLGRRLGASVAIFALFFAATVAVGIFFGGLGFVLRVALGGHAAAAAVEVGLSLVQLAASSALQVAMAASFVALARGERAAPAAAGEPA